MSKLPRVSGKETVTALMRVGFSPVRQRGSHVILVRQTIQGKQTVVVPLHDELDRGTLHEILRQAGVLKEQFVKLL